MTDGGFISDSVVLGAVVPLSNSSMEMTMAKENLYSGEIEIWIRLSWSERQI